MAFPHPTPDVPGSWPHLHAEVARCADVDHVCTLLLQGLSSQTGSHGLESPDMTPGHVCATCWVFEPTGRYTLLVRHRLFTWSAPGGHIEVHENSREGGLRELEEETGLTRFDVSPVFDHPALIHVSDLEGDRPHRHWNIAWLYTAEMDSPLSPAEGARWWPTDALPGGPPDLDETVDRLTDMLRLARGR